MVGRGLGILGVKSAELTPAEIIWKYRAVFQGSDIMTKSGISAAGLFQEISNAPASFTGVRTLLAIAVLLGFDVTVRDALQAYLQARIDGEDRTQTWIELPKEWLPDEWFYDGAKRQRPKYKRSVVLRRLALYGHAESGPLWDGVCRRRWLQRIGRRFQNGRRCGGISICRLCCLCTWMTCFLRASVGWQLYIGKHSTKPLSSRMRQSQLDNLLEHNIRWTNTTSVTTTPLGD